MVSLKARAPADAIVTGNDEKGYDNDDEIERKEKLILTGCTNAGCFHILYLNLFSPASNGGEGEWI